LFSKLTNKEAKGSVHTAAISEFERLKALNQAIKDMYNVV